MVAVACVEERGEDISMLSRVFKSFLPFSSKRRHPYFLIRPLPSQHSIRVLALQLSGYQAQVFEWINDEETSKNLMLTATKRQRPLGAKKLREFRGQLRELMNMFGLGTQHLLGLLGVGLEEEEKEVEG